MALNPVKWLEYVRAVDRLLAVDEKYAALLEKQAATIAAIEARVSKLEGREGIMVAEAKGASAAAAAAATADLARRIGALEERTRGLGRLPPPDED